MTFTYYVAGFVAALGAFTYFFIPRGRYRGAATLVFVLLGGGVFALSFESVGQPKPIEIEWRKLSGARVIGFLPNEADKIIYLWVMLDGVPVSYARPWTPDVEAMQDAWRRRKDTGDEFYLADDDSKVAEVKREPQPPVKEPQ